MRRNAALRVGRVPSQFNLRVRDVFQVALKTLELPLNLVLRLCVEIEVSAVNVYVQGLRPSLPIMPRSCSKAPICGGATTLL